MSRKYSGDYAARAFVNFVRKRAKKHEGGRANGHPQRKSNLSSTENIEIVSDGQDLEFFRKHENLLVLRRRGKSLQEIADAIGDSRLGVFRTLQKAPNARALGVPT